MAHKLSSRLLNFAPLRGRTIIPCPMRYQVTARWYCAMPALLTVVGAYRIERAGMNDDFWDDLLAHIRQRVLVPVVGPDVTVVESDKADQTFSTLIGQRLVE